MTVELKWSIGKSDGNRTRLDVAPFRAYFYWIENGRIFDSRDFSESELGAEIERRQGEGEETTPFEDALKRLR